MLQYVTIKGTVKSAGMFRQQESCTLMGIMAEPSSYIHRVENHEGIRYKLLGKTLGDSWFDIGRFGLVALTLKGHEESLFKRHLSFKSAKAQFTAAPSMSASHPLDTLATLDLQKLKKRLSLVVTPLLKGILQLNFSEDIRNDKHAVDKPYLQGMLSTLVNFPPLSYNEVHLEYIPFKKEVSGWKYCRLSNQW